MEVVLFIISAIILILGVIGIVGGTIYNKKGKFKWFYHDKLGWHKPVSMSIGYDGCSFTSICKYCHKTILMDSQGGWFVREGDEDDSTTGNE